MGFIVVVIVVFCVLILFCFFGITFGSLVWFMIGVCVRLYLVIWCCLGWWGIWVWCFFGFPWDALVFWWDDV